MSRRNILCVLLAGLCFSFLAPNLLLADDYPNKPITCIIPFSAGGTHDLTARVFTSIIPQYLGQPIVVKLMPGAGGQRGTAAAVRAKPDGYTLLYSNKFVDQLQPLIEKLPYNTTKSLVTVWRLNYSPGGPVSLATKPWKTLKDLFAWAKKNPGKLKVGHSGKWGASFTWGAQLLTEAGVEARFLGYQGGGPATQALLAGETDISISMPILQIANYKAGKVRIYALYGDKRLKEFPDVPTLKELGFKSELTMDRVIFVPRGVPENRIKILREALLKLNKDKTYTRMMKRLGENNEYMDGPEYEKLRIEYKKEFQALVKKLGQ